MPTQKSPGGSVFPYYYKGGEIHALKYGSFYKKKDELITLMNAEQMFVKSCNRKLRIWVDFYETELSDTIINEFIQNIIQMRESIIKLAIVGVSVWKQRRLQSLLVKSEIAAFVPVRFFHDPEDAKTWLVSETA